MSDSATAPQKRGAGFLLAVVYVTALFFIWAFVTNLVDPLVKSMMVIYHLSNLEAQLNQFAFFIAYGIMSIPSAWYLSKYGYANSIILGLIGIIAGCVIAFCTGFAHTFVTVLIGLFVAASGITLLQVAANPLIASMGDPKGSSVRLNLSQAFNSMGAYIGGSFGAAFLLKGPLFDKTIEPTQAMKDQGLHFVTNVYLDIAIVFAVFTLAVFLVRNTIAANSPTMPANPESPFKAFGSKWANLGSLGIFLYVGAEVCVISGMIFFLEQPQIFNVPSQVAGYVGPIFMLFAMFGRFIGSWLMTFIKATTMLMVVALGATVLCCVVIATYHMAPTPLGGTVSVFGYDAPLTLGFIPGVAAVLIGLFNSIMFPTIFTLTLERSSAPASATSGLMCMAICGGGFISLAYGQAVDMFLAHFPVGARSLAFVVPLVCYLYVLWFSLAASKAPVHAIEEGVSGGH